MRYILLLQVKIKVFTLLQNNIMTSFYNYKSNFETVQSVYRKML